MEVVVDSHALFWYFSKNKKLGIKAKAILNKSARIIVSTIVLLELLYILQKFGQKNKFSRLINLLKGKKYLIYPIDLVVVRECAKLTKHLEMHDRLIVATAQIFNVPVVTKDKQITREYAKTIW